MAPIPHTSRRDRRGRGIRGDLLHRQLPGFRTRGQQFDDLVVTNVEDLEKRWSKQLRKTEFAVEDVPASDPAPWEDRGVPLARLFPAEAGHPARIVIYRRPVEGRCTSPDQLDQLVRVILVEQVAELLGQDPSVIDPGYQSD